MSGHTPGPWEVRLVEDAWGVDVRIVAPGHVFVAQVDTRDDAPILAAAPELLEALEAARHFIVARPDILDQVDAAIAKARGGGA